jgi:RNA polymerase sigma factor (sigma-70 family)
VVTLRREHPTYGARRLIREFRLPLSHGAADRILYANNLIRPRRRSSSQMDEGARLAVMLGGLGQVIPGDMEGDAFSNQYPIPNPSRVQVAVMFDNGNKESERLDADARSAAITEDIRTLMEEFKADISRQQASKGAPQGTEHPLKASSTDDGSFQLRAAESQQAESRFPSPRNRSPWNGPDDPRFIAYIEKQQRRSAYHSQLAELFGIAQAQKELSDGQLAGIIADGIGSRSKNSESVLFAVVREVVGEYFLARGLLPGRHFWRLVAFWSNLFVAGLLDEMDRRQKLNEKPAGRIVRELIVEESKRPELLRRIAKGVAKWSSFKGERPEPSEDAESEACKELWEHVQCFISTEPPAANPEFLKATITGAFNKILLQVRHDLWYQRKCERGEGKRTESSDARPIGSQDDAPSAPKTQDQKAIEFSKGRQRQLEERILVDQLLSKGILNDQEMKVIEFVKLRELTQAEAAKELRMSQPTVSRHYNSAIEKLRNELVQNKTAASLFDKPPNN